MSVSSTQIVNVALSYLGAEPIMSLDGADDTPNAALATLIYDDLRMDVLEEGRWTFATKRIKLDTPDTEPPGYGYTFAFSVPSNTLSVIEARNDPIFRPNGFSEMDWRFEDDKIVCNSAVVYAKIIVDVEDPNKFTAKFRQALSSRIAAEMAPAITESNTKTQLMWQLYEAKINSAISMDGLQGKSDRIRGTSLIRRR